MGKIFDTTPERLGYLLESIHNREVALPDFQRDFVWDARATEELIESICQNYPAGSLLRIKNSKDFYFAPREFYGAPELDGKKPSYLILDGQQRLTSLYQALYGAGDHRYFVNLQALMDGEDLEACVFYTNRKDGQREFGTIQQQSDRLVFPLSSVFGPGDGFDGWLDEALELRMENAEARRVLKKKLREVYKVSIDPLEQYEFPMVTLAEGTSAAAVCTIFETLNRTGVKLSVFDLLAARFWPQSVRLRDMWEKALSDYPALAAFDVDPYYALQAIALYAASSAPSCKRKDVLQLSVEQIRTGWDDVIRGLAHTLEILSNDCGVLVPAWLPYNTILIPSAAALATTKDKKGPAVGAMRDRFKRWFWCSVFAQAYENAPNSQAAKDYVELKGWFTGGESPQTVKDFSFRPEVLRETTPRQRALYRGVMALVLRNGSRDFHKKVPITASMIAEEKIEDHHILPKGFLDDAGIVAKGQTKDCVLNRTLIDRETNNNIRKKAPSLYLKEIEDTMGAAALAEVLDSHLLPSAKHDALWKDDFDRFLTLRQERICSVIQAVTG
ncbi:MAG TPA: DUF262 domain-containing protein [Kiritimatiellia bacterium]|nr:DUF262 domain-containing protein [Kiritimatiellia bacterium]